VDGPGLRHEGTENRGADGTVPDSVEYDPDDERLAIGDGEIAPVGDGVWSFPVSGWSVLEGWLRWRLREPVGKARSSGSPLDKIRPSAWLHEYTVELLELIWALERTTKLHDDQAELLARVCDSETVKAGDSRKTEEWIVRALLAGAPGPPVPSPPHGPA
jgi:hypothetical protein